MPRPWRFRECPRCKVEFPAGELGYSGYRRGAWGSGPEASRSCPRCGHRDRTSAFEVTRDTRTGFVRDNDEWRVQYLAVLASPRWRALRATVIEGQGWRCASCGTFGGVTRSVLELHHKSYANLGHESADDVVGLCRVCHQEANDRQAPRSGAKPIESPAPVEPDVQIAWLADQPEQNEGDRDEHAA